MVTLCILSGEKKRACFLRLQKPFSTSSRFSCLYFGLRGTPAVTGGPPPCILSALTVATNTTALGVSPENRHCKKIYRSHLELEMDM